MTNKEEAWAKVLAEILGAHRGAQKFTQLMEKENLPPLKVKIVDPEPNRAENLALSWQYPQIEAVGIQDRAETTLANYPDIRLVAIDDLVSMAAIVASGRQKILLTGILLSSDFPPRLGLVPGFGLVILEEDLKTKQEAHQLMKILANLVGKRTSSQAMSADWVNSIQMETTRTVLHQELVKDFQTFLAGQLSSSRLFVVETFTPSPPHVFPLKLVPLSSARLKYLEMRQKALEIAQETPELSAVAIAFFKPTQPWLYITFLTKRQRWLTRRTVEFPPSPRRLRIYQEEQEELHRPIIYATD